MKIALNGIRIFANHGWYDEEAILGNEFVIDICVNTGSQLNDSDDLSDTLNYESLYRVVHIEMAHRSKLLENVLYRIKSHLISNYPHGVKGLSLSIRKLNPPLGGPVESSEVSIDEDYSKKCAKCNSNFNCFNAKDCWCQTVNLSNVTRSDLQRQYIGCLCESCLSAFATVPH